MQGLDCIVLLWTLYYVLIISRANLSLLFIWEIDLNFLLEQLKNVKVKIKMRVDDAWMYKLLLAYSRVTKMFFIKDLIIHFSSIFLSLFFKLVFILIFHFFFKKNLFGSFYISIILHEHDLFPIHPFCSFFVTPLESPTSPQVSQDVGYLVLVRLIRSCKVASTSSNERHATISWNRVGCTIL